MIQWTLMESDIMIAESEIETIEKQLREICDAEQRQLGLDGVKIDIVFDDWHEEGNANPKTNTIKISLAKCLTTYEHALQNGHQSIRHELRHLWQRKHNKEHVEWWDAHGEYYDELIGDGKEYDYCTIEIDAEAYAKGGTGQEYQLNKTTNELEMMMREYYENRSISEQNNTEELSKIVSDYLENKKKLQKQY